MVSLSWAGLCVVGWSYQATHATRGAEVRLQVDGGRVRGVGGWAARHVEVSSTRSVMCVCACVSNAIRTDAETRNGPLSMEARPRCPMFLLYFHVKVTLLSRRGWRGRRRGGTYHGWKLHILGCWMDYEIEGPGRRTGSGRRSWEDDMIRDSFAFEGCI